MQKYRYFDHTGDLGVDVFGADLPELFRHAGEALTDTVTDAATIRTRTSKTVSLRADGVEQLMVRWLNELVYLFETDSLLPVAFDIDVLDNDRIEATVRGEVYDADRHPIKTTVKGATYHQLEIVQEKGRWRARIIFDL